MLDHDGDDLPPTVRDAILARTVNLEDAARDLLDLLVCAPEAIPDRLLPQLGIGVSALRSLHQAGLIRRSQRGVAFRHDLCRMAIAGSLPPGGEAALHRRMLDALEAGASAEPAVLVHHARGAGDPERVLRYARQPASRPRAPGRTPRRPTSSSWLWTAGRRVAGRRGPTCWSGWPTEHYVLDRLEEAISSATQALRLRQQVGDVAAVSADHQALADYEWYRADRGAADRHAADAVAVLGGGRTSRRCSGSCPAHCRPTSPCRPTTSRGRATLLGQASGPADRSDDWLLGRPHPAARRHLLGRRGPRRRPRARCSGSSAPAVDQIDEIHSSGFSNLAYLDVEQRRLPEAAAVLGRQPAADRGVRPPRLPRLAARCPRTSRARPGRLATGPGRRGRPCSPGRARRSRAPGRISSAVSSLFVARGTPAATWTTPGTSRTGWANRCGSCRRQPPSSSRSGCPAPRTGGSTRRSACSAVSTASASSGPAETSRSGCAGWTPGW